MTEQLYQDSNGVKYKKSILLSGKTWWMIKRPDRWGIMEWYVKSGMMDENSLTKINT